MQDILRGTILINDIQVDKFYLGRTGQYISGSGGNIEIKSSTFHLERDGDLNMQGNVTASNIMINGNAKIQGAVTASDLLIDGSARITDTVQIGGLVGGNVIFFDDFTTFTNSNVNNISGSGNAPQSDGSGQGYYDYVGGGEKGDKLLSSQSDTFNNNGTVWRLGDDDNDDMSWYSSNTLIPINSSSLYEYEIRLKKPEANGGIDGQYAGFTAFTSDKVPVTVTGDPGSNNYGSAHYVALKNTSIGPSYEVHRGYIKGHNIDGSAAGNLHTDKTDPGTFTSASIGGFFAPMILANYNGQEGEVHIDYIKVTEFNNGGGSTKITGDNITTGKITSTNFGSTSGSQMNLNLGTIVMGGSSDPDFSVNAVGDVTASNALFDGYAAARALRTIPITITNSNKNNFCVASTTSEGTTVTTIHLDGSVNSGASNGVPNTYPDRVTAHVILNLDCKETSGDVGAIVNIVPPQLPGGESVQITIEVATGKDVELCIENNNTTTAFGYAHSAGAVAATPSFSV